MGTGSSSDLISLPKGGGALKGLGEKFSPDLFTGTGNFTIPFALPPGRNGLQPQLSLSFSTGNGNGAFGLGWSLSIPGVTRKTSKGIPRYRDNPDDPSLKPDVFILSGAEDLVPVGDTPEGAQRYRPRTEGLFALIDHFRYPGNNYWKVQSKDGLISYYGTPGSAGADPAVIVNPAPTDRNKIFAWKLSCTEDPFGNRIEYKYIRDQGKRDDHESDPAKWDQLYLQQIRYVDYTDSADQTQYLVTVDFLYDNDLVPPGGGDKKERPDPFSEFRSGFQIRTRRRCKWVVVKTHPTPSQEQLVRAYEFVYLDERTDLPNLRDILPLNGVSLVSQVNVIGYNDTNQPSRELPPLEFAYSRFEPSKRTFSAVTGKALPPVSLGHPDFELVDLFGNGLPDIFEMNDTVRYWRNIGGGRFDLPRSMPEAPAGLRLADSGVQLIDANGDGRTDLLVTTAELPGYYSLTFQGGWDRKKSFQRYRQAPSFNLEDPEVRLVDLDGDGVTDAIRAGTRLECYFNDPHQGWQPGGDHVRFKERRSDGFPANFSDPRVKWADMTGDGMQDVVLIHNRRIDYWPNLGYGEFGPRVTMHTAPELPLDYDPRRLLVGDVDGDGLADIIYIENRQLTLWINQGGNSWSERKVIYGTPAVTDIDSVRLVDLLGTGVSGVLWTQEARGDARDRYFFFDFTGGVKPYLLTEMNNHIGAITRVEYAPSTREYLRDQAEKSTQWRTPLPFPVQVVSRVEVIDEISKGKLTTEYRYHHGYWDGAEREFRGFGMVEQLDTEVIEEHNKSGLHGETAIFEKVETHFSPPTLTKTWFHQGPVGEEFGLWKEQDYTAEYWRGDQQILKHTEAVNTFLHTLPQRRIKRDALRTLRGSILRSELYALDGSPREDRPYIVTEYAYGLREEEIPADNNSSRERIFFPYGTAQRTTQWERGDDPLTQFSFTGKYDAYGQPLSQSALAMPRRSVKRLPRRSADVADEAGVLVTHTRTVYAEPGTGVDRYIHNRVARSTSFTFTNKPQVSETKPSIALAELAKSLHDQFEVYLQNWQPIQGATSNYQILAHAVSYYDGAAYVGEDLGKTGLYGAPTRSESLIFTDDILNKAYNDTGAQRRPAYLGGTATLPPGAPANFGADHGYLDKRNSIAGYVPGYYVSAQQQKFDFQDGVAKPRGLPVAMRDPLNHASTIDQYDDFQFLPLKVTNPKGMSISAEYNLRVLQPRKVTDPNGNASEVAFSPSGLVTSSWIKGKNGEGDQTEPSSKLSYDFLAFRNTGKPIYVRAIKRCHHDTETDISLPDRNKTIESHEYSDGFGRVIQTRTQGEDVRFGDARLGGGESVLPADQNDGRGNSVVGIANNDVNHPNVVVSGWQVYDNKGKVVEKYEPFFSKGWDFEPETDSRHGVHAEMYYDPRGQVIHTVNPDGSEQLVIYGVPVRLDDPPLSPRDATKFTPTLWEAYTYDANDNAGRTHPSDATAIDYQHHWNTPASIAIDALGRTVRAVARHREGITTHIEEHLTESRYDMQGNLLAISDALGRHAFSYIYDLAKHALRTGSIDAGTKHVVLNAVGNPIEGHDAKGAVVLHTYDVLNRPTHLWARDKMNDSVTLREKLIYGDDAGVTAPANHHLLLGKLYQHYDEAGVVTVASYDFKGNVLESGRRVISDDFMLANVRAQTGPNWALNAPRVDWATQTNILEATEYRTRSAYDALNRIKWSDYPQAANGERYRLRPEYNRAGVLERVDLEGPLGTGDTGLRQNYVQRLAYNAKGQRTFIAYGNGKITRYAYDPKTFRLVRMRTEGYSQPNSLTYQPGSGVLQDLAYQYDLGGNILRIIDRTSGSGIRNNPRAAAYPELQTLLAAGDALVRDFAYDPLYRLVSATGRESKNIPMTSRPWSDVKRNGYGSGQHGTPDQDNAPNLTTLYREEYAYDAAGNMLTLCHNQSVQRSGVVDWNVAWSRRFGMDGRNPEQWRREATDHLTGEWINPPSNRLTHVEDRASGVATPPSVPQTHWYDANGNMVRENTERHFEWDHSDRMKVFRNQTGTSEPTTYALYLYDSAGMRVKKLVWKSGGYTTTTYLGAAFEHHKEVKPGAIQENNHLHVMDDKQRIAIKRVGPAFNGDGAAGHPVQYHLGDHLGSSAVVVSGDGTWINREEFFPYGETSFGSFGRKRYRYTGMERDEESGLSYHGARYYAAVQIRWLSCDPAFWADNLCLYVYARNSPLRWIDTTGRSAAEKWIEVGEAGAKLGRHLRAVPTPPPAPPPAAGVGVGAAGIASVIGVGLAAIAWTYHICSQTEKALNDLDAAERAADLQKKYLDSMMENAWHTGRISREQYIDYLKSGRVYFIGSESTDIGSESTDNSSGFRGFSYIYHGRFSESPELCELWQRASAGVSDWNEARKNFWNLVRTDQGSSAQVVRTMLREAGFVFRENSDPTTAPILASHIPQFSEDRAKDWAGDDPYRQGIVQKLIEARASGDVPKNDFSDRVLSIDHVKARANGGAVFDPSNLRFELKRDNSFKGDR